MADRESWIASRAFTRRVLGECLGVPARQLEFVAGADGKPAVADRRDVSFNVSHSGQVVVLAVTAAGAVGVDVELVRDDIDALALARTAFGDEVATELAALPATERTAEFFRRWVHREATGKCVGVGLGELPPGTGPIWTRDVPSPTGYLAAVAVSD